MASDDSYYWSMSRIYILKDSFVCHLWYRFPTTTFFVVDSWEVRTTSRSRPRRTSSLYGFDFCGHAERALVVKIAYGCPKYKSRQQFFPCFVKYHKRKIVYFLQSLCHCASLKGLSNLAKGLVLFFLFFTLRYLKWRDETLNLSACFFFHKQKFFPNVLRSVSKALSNKSNAISCSAAWNQKKTAKETPEIYFCFQ